MLCIVLSVAETKQRTEKVSDSLNIHTPLFIRRSSTCSAFCSVLFSRFYSIETIDNAYKIIAVPQPHLHCLNWRLVRAFLSIFACDMVRM